MFHPYLVGCWGPSNQIVKTGVQCSSKPRYCDGELLPSGLIRRSDPSKYVLIPEKKRVVNLPASAKDSWLFPLNYNIVIGLIVYFNY